MYKKQKRAILNVFIHMEDFEFEELKAQHEQHLLW